MPNLGTPKSSDAESLREQLGYIDEDAFFDLIGVTKGTGRNRQSAGTLPPHYKIGKKKLYRLAEVEAWIRRRRVARNAA